MSSEQHAESILDETVPSAYLRHGDAAKEQPEPAFPELIHHAEKRDQPSAQTTSSGSGTVVSPAARAGPKESDNEKSNQRASSESSGGSSPSSPPPLQLARSDTLNRQTSVDSYGNTYPEGGLRAWLVVYGSFSGMTASFGLMNTIGTYQAYLSTHQLSHLDESTIGWIFSIYTFMAFFCGVQIGPVFDAKGPRLLVLAGTLCMVGGTLGIAESTELWHFILSFSLAAGLGTSLIFTPAIGSIAHFFLIRRASATGLATTGGSIGGIIFPLMLQRLFPHVGFRWATRILAFIFLFQLIVANILIRSRLPPPPKGSPATSMWPDWRIFKNLTFCLTTAGTFFVEWALFVPLTYITSYSIAHGISPSFSYQLLAVLNAGSFFGRWAPGYVADKFGRFNTMIVTVGICMISVLLLWLTCSVSVNIVPQIIVFALIFGFASGSNISLVPVCVGQLCETEVFGRWYASLYTIVSFGCLTGIPLAGGILSQEDGGYEGLIVFVGVAYAAGLVSFTAARVREVGWGLKQIY